MTSPTVGTITVLDDLPAGLKLKGASGAGWNCGASTVGAQHVECVLTSTPRPRRPGAHRSKPGSTSSTRPPKPAPSINTAYVDTPRDTRGVPADAAITDNNTSTADDHGRRGRSLDRIAPTPVTSPSGPKTSYSLTIRNVGFFGTDPGESVTVTDDLPDGIVPTGDFEYSRPGWSCVVDEGDVECTLPGTGPDGLRPWSRRPPLRSTSRSPSPTPPPTIPRQSPWFRPRDSNPTLSPNNRAVDPIHVNRIDLAASLPRRRSPPRAGGIGEINVDLTNIGTARHLAPRRSSRSRSRPVLRTARPVRPSPAGPAASPGAGTQVTCTRTPIIASGWNRSAAEGPDERRLPRPRRPGTRSSTSPPPVKLRPASANNSATVAQSLETVDLDGHQVARSVQVVKAGTAFELQDLRRERRQHGFDRNHPGRRHGQLDVRERDRRAAPAGTALSPATTWPAPGTAPIAGRLPGTDDHGRFRHSETTPQAPATRPPRSPTAVTRSRPTTPTATRSRSSHPPTSRSRSTSPPR